jgi:hypothetical protein
MSVEKTFPDLPGWRFSLKEIAAPPETMTVPAGKPATTRSTVSGSVREREPTIATCFMDGKLAASSDAEQLLAPTFCASGQREANSCAH